VVDLESKWLPGVQGASPLLLAFRELGRYLAAAQSATNPYYQLNHLERARTLLVSLKNQLLSEKPYVVDALSGTYDTWERVVQSMYSSVQAAVAGRVPNPFRADAPLTPELGREVFRGREQAIERVRALLSDAGKSYSIAVLGPRRFGKTSLLRMLRDLIPDAFFVFLIYKTILLIHRSHSSVPSLQGLLSRRGGTAGSCSRNFRWVVYSRQQPGGSRS
jgi:hypothetical protein